MPLITKKSFLPSPSGVNTSGINKFTSGSSRTVGLFSPASVALPFPLGSGSFPVSEESRTIPPSAPKPAPIAVLVNERTPFGVILRINVIVSVWPGARALPVATNTTGTLRDSLRYRIIDRGGVPEMKFYSKGAQQYADVIEQGRRPDKGFPPPPKLIAWITKKGLKPRDASGKFIRVNDIDKWRSGLAFVIGRKIAKDGFKGIYYWQEAIDEELRIRGKDVSRMIEKYVVRKINEGWL